ncbi:hypothetical protein EDB87DRAFT_1574948 [Lactarius vividus]|nr:hypothetical protein EDB87DRAFT_1574948 [Lactarius vividus]
MSCGGGSKSAAKPAPQKVVDLSAEIRDLERDTALHPHPDSTRPRQEPAMTLLPWCPTPGSTRPQTEETCPSEPEEEGPGTPLDEVRDTTVDEVRGTRPPEETSLGTTEELNATSQPVTRMKVMSIIIYRIPQARGKIGRASAKEGLAAVMRNSKAIRRVLERTLAETDISYLYIRRGSTRG